MNKERLYKTQTRWLFHAHIKLKIPVHFDDKVFDDLFSVLEHIDRTYNSYVEDSFFDRINKRAGEFVTVDRETIVLLKQLIYFFHFFDGEYDISIMPLIRLWGFYKDEIRKIPTQNEIQEVKQLVDFTKIELDAKRVRIAQRQELITGSFLKSYAVDRLLVRMHLLGIKDALINAGGSTLCSLNKDETHPYSRVLVNNVESGQKLFSLRLNNKCYSTSAQSSTFLEIDGQRYGHIISPVTGMPSTNKQVGIISDNCFVGDVVSTGLYNLSDEEFDLKMRLLSSKFGVEGFRINKSGNIQMSEGFESYILY